MAPILELRGVVKRFGGVAAVSGVSLSLERGRIYGLIGPNGSGKTTLFNCITGVDQADEGLIRFKGRRIDRLKPHQIFHLGIGRTFQVIRVFPELTALENLLVVTTTGYDEARRRAQELLEFVKLEGLAGEFAGNLSYGQQKLVEFIRVLMTDPEMILLDEPAAGVNRTLLNELLDAVRRLRDQGKTICWSRIKVGQCPADMFVPITARSWPRGRPPHPSDGGHEAISPLGPAAGTDLGPPLALTTRAAAALHRLALAQGAVP